MRTVWISTAALCGILLITVNVSAQEPLRREGDSVSPPHWNERLTTAPPPSYATPSFEMGPEHFFSAQFLLGTETGLRFQATFQHECNRAWVGEVFLGGAVTTYGASGCLGVGGRVQYALASGMWHDHLIVSPGLDLMLLFEGAGVNEPYQNVLFLAPGVDIAWLHDFSPHFGLELGLHLGLGIGLTGTDSDGGSAAGQLTPLFGVFTGVRF